MSSTTKEKPIIFSAEMVRAILAGRKTQTRRVVTPQPERRPCECPYSSAGWALEGVPNEFGVTGCRCYEEVRCPWNCDRLWVREAWGLSASANCSAYGIRRGDVLRGEWDLIKRDIPWCFHYRADDQRPDMAWRSPIHMPRVASRITLELTGVRVERLQEICGDDVTDEGFELPWEVSYQRFWKTWDALNAKRGYPWDSNPWVWVLEFRRIEQ